MSEVRFDLAELPLGTIKVVELNDEPIAVVNTAEGIFAVSDTCSHAEVSLSEGSLEGCLLECWMHGAAFDVRTGEPTSPPATRPIKTYPVRTEEHADRTEVVVTDEENL